MHLQLNNTIIETDNEGYLLNTDDWSPELAEVIARGENMELTDDRLEVVHLVREHFEERECIPELRTVLKALREKHGQEKVTRKYIYRMFPYGYGQQACKIAGMRKPLKLLLDL